MSGGDDNSLYASLLETCLKSTTATLVPIASGSNLDAHHSSITGYNNNNVLACGQVIRSNLYTLQEFELTILATLFLYLLIRPSGDGVLQFMTRLSALYT